jgi:Transcriptional regulator
MSDIHPTKLTIMKAALNIFIQKGFSGATTKEIAQAARIAEGTVFRHFSNKTEILHGIVERFIPLIGLDSLEKVIEESKGLDKREAFRYIVHNRFNIHIIDEAVALIRIIHNEINYDPKLKVIYYEKVYLPTRRLLSDFFVEGMEQGIFRKMDPDLPTSMLLSFIIFEIYGRCSPKAECKDIPFTADDLVDIMLSGISTKK